MRLQEELLKLQQRFTDQLDGEERRRLDAIEQWKKQADELRSLLDAHQTAAHKLKADHDEEKALWSRQHQDHVLSVEKLYSNRAKALEGELFEVSFRHGVNSLLGGEWLALVWP